MSYSVIIVAAGEGKRAGLGYNKVLTKINNKAIIEYSLDFFNHDTRCKQVILVINKKDQDTIHSHYKDRADVIVTGGTLRQDSVQNGLEHVKEDTVLIHDGARPYIDKDAIERLLIALKTTKAASLALPIYETVKRVHNDVFLETLDRNELMLMQTPQGFLTSTIRKAYQKKNNNEYTCDITLVSAVLGIEAQAVLGHRNNVKVTTKEDIVLMEMMLA